MTGRRLSRIHQSQRTLEKLLDFITEMDKVVGAIAHIGELKFQNDDDFVDRLSRRYTTFFLVLFSVIVSTKQYVGEPIACWVPAQFTNSHEEYANKVCWVSNTYYLPFQTKRIPQTGEPRQMIGYYQWIPMILICQAILFFLPCVFWRILNRQSGINLTTIIDASMACARTTLLGDAREKTIKYVTNQLDVYLSSIPGEGFDCWSRMKRLASKRFLFLCGHSSGNYLSMVYLMIKLLYIFNAIGQIFLLNLFLGTDYHMFGLQVLTALLRSEDWEPTSRFPRVTLCDFRVRSLGQTNRHTVQCVLPINLFNEKIYVFIWFWFMFIVTVTVASFLSWSWKSSTSQSQTFYIRQHLRCLDRLSRETSNHIGRFTQDYLRKDGVFILRLVSKNAGDMVAAELCSALWDVYNRDRRLLCDVIRGGANNL